MNANRDVRTIRDAIRWATATEVAAPKVGNVTPADRFDDLTADDFLVAGRIVAQSLTRFEMPLGARIRNAVNRVRRRCGTNVNLGITLLLAPLAEAGYYGDLSQDVDARIAASTDDDCHQILLAIGESQAGGLSTQTMHDVHRVVADPSQDEDRTFGDPNPPSREAAKSIRDVMALAADRDEIAAWWSRGYDPLFDVVVPILQRNRLAHADWERAIANAHIELLRRTPDTLIARKCGWSTAVEVQTLANQTDPNDSDSVKRLDAFLRSDGNRLNPGTTADKIAAGLFVIALHQNIASGNDPVSNVSTHHPTRHA